MDKSKINQSFEKLYNRTYTDIYKYILLKVSPKETAEDILQNIYLELYRKMLSGETILRPKHFLLTVAKRRVADHYRSAPDEESFDENIAIVDERALENLENDDSFLYEDIMRSLEQSDTTAYRIFYLHYACGHTLQKTAKLLGMTESTVKSKMYRTLSKLKKQLTEEDNYALFRRSR